MHCDSLDSLGFHIGPCVAVPASFPDAGEISLVPDSLQMDSTPSSNRAPLVKIVQRLSPKCSVITYVRPEDIRALRRPPKERNCDSPASEQRYEDNSSEEWSYGCDVQEILGQQTLRGTVFIAREAPILVQQQVATYAGSELDIGGLTALNEPQQGCDCNNRGP